MALTRKPFQGVINIMRFNWHFYLAAVAVIAFALFYSQYFSSQIQPIIIVIAALAFVNLGGSLLVSLYVYDISDLYQLNWLPSLNGQKVVNIHSGFDETTTIIKGKFPAAQLSVCDFYNPDEHTEISIKRARRIYPPNKDTIEISTTNIPFSRDVFDYVLLILSAHEIRTQKERVDFFMEVHRITNDNGKILVTEHLRDFNNFIAYTIGFFHFHSKKTWIQTFNQANLHVKSAIKTTPFVTTFILEKHGNTL